jgi:mRNA interferase MazF
MKRGEVWTYLDDAYASKARPVVVIQNDAYSSFNTVLVCLLTSFDSKDKPPRIQIEPDEHNGLYATSWIMVEKIYGANKDEMGRCIGKLSQEDMRRLDQAIVHILALEVTWECAEKSLA